MKAQAFAITTLVILSLLFAGIALVISQAEIIKGPDDQFYEVQRESETISSLLLAKPVPTNYDEDSIKRLGILSDQGVTESTLNEYGSLGYYQTKLLLGSEGDYLFFFLDENDQPIEIGGREYWGWNEGSELNGGSSLEDAVDYIVEQSSTLSKTEQFVQLTENGELRNRNMITYVWQWADGEVPLALTTPPHEFGLTGFISSSKGSYSSGETIGLTS